MKADNISYSYEKEQVIKDVSIRFDVGVTTLIGPNGSGKSTLLKILSGQIKNYSGSIEYDGDNIKNLSVSQISRLLSYFNQKEQIYGLISVESIFEMSNLKNIDYTKYLDYFGLTDKLKLPFNQLSGGQQQVILVLAVMVEQTPYVYLDEPFNNLDPLYKAKLVKLIKRSEQNFFIVDHDLDTLSILADRILLYKNGKIVKSGSVELLTENNLKNIFGTEFKIHQDVNGNRRLIQDF
ncbi:ABC transporter ATP-binding protein [Companilactobacillus baiquanensis]|uniref:ABC transporter ATP-binding protein n=1 Tax=Companilactobacillus baiquanensis TaxID=2486005 RepID=A0ABW1V0P2_9LACO|nr:ABC transporter ATP-binding protein [Companilactobacillus baiquanensis]